MAERKECKKYINCGFRKELAGCPLSCIHYKHKDEVRVVRCKDCKHYDNLSGLDNDYRCTIFCGCYDKPYPTEPDSFCSYGERKDNERKAD